MPKKYYIFLTDLIFKDFFNYLPIIARIRNQLKIKESADKSAFFSGFFVRIQISQNIQIFIPNYYINKFIFLY